MKDNSILNARFSGRKRRPSRTISLFYSAGTSSSPTELSCSVIIYMSRNARNDHFEFDLSPSYRTLHLSVAAFRISRSVHDQVPKVF